MNPPAWQDSDKYWPTCSGNDLAAQIIQRFRWFEFNLRERDLARMKVATWAYYGCDEDGSETYSIDRLGSQDQVRKLMDNEYRSVLQNKLAIATAEPGGFLPVPINSDADAQATSMLTRGVLDYYFDAKKGDKVASRAAEMTENLGWAWVDVPWDDQLGPVVGKRPMMGEAPAMPDGAEPGMLPPPRQMEGLAEVLAGDVKFTPMMPSDVAFDYDARGELEWLILRHWVNKHNLAAQVEKRGTPGALELAKRIRSFAYVVDRDDISFELRSGKGDSAARTRMHSDEVPLYELRHVKTPACAQGRWARCLSADLLLDEGPERYFTKAGSDLACYRISAGERYGTPRAYTSAHDMLGLQRAVDALTSIAYSNLAGLGLNAIVSYEGSDFKADDVREGLLNITVKDPSLKPDLLEFGSTPKEGLDLRQQLKADMGTKGGMDALSMGRDTRQLAASAMALLDTKTQRAVSGTRGAFNELRREMATGLLKRFEQFGKHSRTLPMVAGKSKRLLFSGFTGPELGVDRVKVEDLSPVMRSQGGRLEVSRLVLEAKAQGIQPEVVISLVETGKWDGFNDGVMAEQMTIREENERLMAGEVLDSPPPQVDPMTGAPIPPPPGAPPPTATAIFTDNPLTHILGHRQVMQSPTARRNPQIVENFRNHIMAHVRDLMTWAQGDPMMLAIHGPPPPLAPPMQPGPEGEGGEPGAGPPASAAPKGPQQARLPTNPATREQWTATGEVSNG